ncbi:MAG: M23 family metallopeptidase [Caldilineaceae bacterium]|nr:M23 family metallopeptidase [Caldilineaceae bacterium]
MILIHFTNTFSLSWFVKLITTLIGSYSRSRREAQNRSASTGGHVLRRIYGHIVAQGLGAEKLPAIWHTPGLPRRNLTAASQFGMASLLVLMAWVYWPTEVAAPAVAAKASMQPVLSINSPAIPSAPQPSNASQPSTSESTSVSSRQIASTKERFAALTAPEAAQPAASEADWEPAAPLQPFGSEIVDRRDQPDTGLQGTAAPAAEDDPANGPSRPGGLADLLASLADVTEGPRQAVGQIVAGVGELTAGASESKRAAAEAQPTAPPPVPQPTPGPVPLLVPGPQWADFTPVAAPAVDHFWLGQPQPTGYNQFYSPNYQFGSTANNRYRIHHGVDIASDSGTPVLAMGEGEVVHAGPDNPALLGPYNNFYGNAVVVRLNRRLSTPEGDQDVYVLLGHLSAVYVERGQQVTPDVVVGAVGMTGIAIGPHLHVEVRVGENSYLDSVNPALWMQNPPGTGSVAARLLTADGRSWSDARLSLLRYEGGGTRWVRTIEIYPDAENISADPAWGENGALSQLAAGGYWIGGVVNGEKFGQNITIYPGETTFVELRTQQ